MVESTVRAMAEIDHEGPVPPYVQVADELERQIKAGILPAGRPIPSEQTLMQEFGLARGTVRRAVNLLRERGLIFTVPGRGSYVGQPPTP